MLALEPRDEILEWLEGLSLSNWIFIAAVLLGWLLPLIKGFWEKERKRREEQTPGTEGPIEPR